MQGSLDYLLGGDRGGIKQCTGMVNLRDFPE